MPRLTASSSLRRPTGENPAARTFLHVLRTVYIYVKKMATWRINLVPCRANLEDVKSKLIVERHEREQETNNNKLMLKVQLSRHRSYSLECDR